MPMKNPPHAGELKPSVPRGRSAGQFRRAHSAGHVPPAPGKGSILGPKGAHGDGIEDLADCQRRHARPVAPGDWRLTRTPI
jgi:hypothetical protein